MEWTDVQDIVLKFIFCNAFYDMRAASLVWDKHQHKETKKILDFVPDMEWTGVKDIVLKLIV